MSQNHYFPYYCGGIFALDARQQAALHGLLCTCWLAHGEITCNLGRETQAGV
eukprot:COSAG05_NODE_373_length_10684_cov_22.075012_12_plen_52_part_00